MFSKKGFFWNPGPSELQSEVTNVLVQSFPEHCQVEVPLRQYVADLVVDGKTEAGSSQVAVVEMKMGDPELLLPSSTPSQIRDFAAEARAKFKSPIIPVLVTNYRLPDALRQDLKQDGVKVLLLSDTQPGEEGIRVLPPRSPETFAKLGSEFAKLVGFEVKRTLPQGLTASSEPPTARV